MLKKLFISISFISLITSNILLITNSTYHSFSSELLEKLPFTDLLVNGPNRNMKMLEAENKNLKSLNKLIEMRSSKIAKISKRIAYRTVRNVSIDLGSLVAEATPYIGIGFVVLSTSLDVKDGCDTIKDLNEINDSLGEQGSHVDENEVCGIKIPDAKELLEKANNDIGGTLYEMLN